jgi:hypothetical protein
MRAFPEKGAVPISNSPVKMSDRSTTLLQGFRENAAGLLEKLGQERIADSLAIEIDHEKISTLCCWYG